MLRASFLCGFGLLFAGSAVRTASGQTFLGPISTAGYGQNSGQPFGLAWGPNGHLYVSLAGQSAFVNPQAFNNNVVVRIDPATGSIAGMVPVGLYPEEIAFASASSSPPVGIVTNSTDSSVTIFDVGTDAPIATVVLGPFFALYPFGVVTNAAGTRAWVSVGDGSQRLFAIDLDPASATAFQEIPSELTVLASGSAGRFVRSGADLVLPTTAYLPSFSGSTAAIERRPLPGTFGAVASAVLRSEGSFSAYPSAQDTVIGPDGVAYVAGYDMGKRIYGFSPTTGEFVRAFPSGTAIGAHTGLAISPDGSILVVCDIASEEVAFLDVARGTVISIVHTPSVGFGYFQPNDAIFSPDGSRVYVTCQGSEAVLVFSAPASPSPFAPPLAFTVQPTVPSVGSSVTLATAGVAASESVFVVADTSDVAVDLGAAGVLHFTASASLVASAVGSDVLLTTPTPTGAAYYGFNFLCQAVAIDLGALTIRLSAQVPVVLQ
ncbi:MAG: hypothetical protein JNJ88_12415 [Planctomycetes bacterium]|nr:hypothetical protein [Planctomycetota bacterium]